MKNIKAIKQSILASWNNKNIPLSRLFLYGVIVYLLLLLVLTVMWNRQVKTFDVNAYAVHLNNGQKPSPSAMSFAVMHGVTDKLLRKSGGLISNDAFFPGVWLDDMPSWEKGVLYALRQYQQFTMDMQADGSELVMQLAVAQKALNTSRDSWQFPSAQTEYTNARHIFKTQFVKVNASQSSEKKQTANRHNKNQKRQSVVMLKAWLQQLEFELARYNNQLLASVGDRKAVVPLTKQDGDESPLVLSKTAWSKLDNVVYEVRGYAWASDHFLQTLAIEYASLFEDKKLQSLLQTAQAELANSQQAIWSPVILNGKGMGVLANHSLVMASYISNAQHAIGQIYRAL